MALNSVAALAAVHALGLDWRDAAMRFGYAPPPPGRGSRYSITLEGRRIMVMGDAYNANPESMIASMELLAQLEPKSGGRRVAVLGDMLELGTGAPGFHDDLAEPIDTAGVEKVYLAGKLMTHLWSKFHPVDAAPGSTWPRS